MRRAPHATPPLAARCLTRLAGLCLAGLAGLAGLTGLTGPALAAPPAGAEAPASAAPAKGAASAPRLLLRGPDGKPHRATLPPLQRLRPVDVAAIEAAHQRRLAEQARARKPQLRALDPKILASIQASQIQLSKAPLEASVTEWIGLVQRALRTAKVSP